MIEQTIVYTLRRIKMPLFKIAGNQIVEYEQTIKANTIEEAQDIFLMNLYDLKPVDEHSWIWHDAEEIT